MLATISAQMQVIKKGLHISPRSLLVSRDNYFLLMQYRTTYFIPPEHMIYPNEYGLVYGLVIRVVPGENILLVH